ncbi:hypothetical protein ACFQWB_09995 [Paenibacillus thermoaerophilus]|uniref:Uncharacterized protein n=1 Tax=Paenibacillus thermoaerophilus TaxID=1215385 RepID=A0ABW2V4T9_9BACL|nr:hypothetical protein [Paenibacillus thermoaerophilus]TMV06730.1 hypothetical protein FE781_16095 [Paenibacillus thermoaerophilus]
MTTGDNRLTYSPLPLRHQVINRWLLSGIFTRNVRFEPMTMEGDVNDWLIKGFSIHENPCRKEFVDQRRASVPELPFAAPPAPGDSVSLWGSEARWDLYFPWGNPRVEESGFYYVPTHMLRYGYTVIVSPTAHQAVFNLKTCGGVALWVNGRLVCDFTPFTRNIEQQTQVEVELQAGENTFVVCHEDLAERDTLYHFTLEYTGTESLEIRIPLTDSETAEAVLRMEEALGRAYFPKDNATDEEIRIVFEQPFSEKISFDVNYVSFFDGKYSMRRELEPGQQYLVLGHTDDFGIDYKYFELVTRIGQAAIRKPFGIELYNSRFQPRNSREMTVAERKRVALECVAELGIPNIHTAIAKLKTGGSPEQSREMILKGLVGIRERRDCADFYLIALFRFWRDYRDSGLFDEDFWAQIKDTILGFRYWIDEPGDDVMWFFSENHALLFHSCQLLAGQLFPDDVFVNSGETGVQRREKAERQLLEWFDRFFAEGLAEWNSNAYIPIDFLGLIQLHDLAELPALREKAKQAMDLLYFYMAAEAHEGYLTSTFGRSYEKELLGNHAAGTTSLIWVGYGVGNVNSTAFNVSVYLSDYEPPREYAGLTELKPEEELEFRLEQGKDGYAKLIHYRTRSFVLSSISDFRPGMKGYQEHVLHLALSPEAQVWVNHPGEIYPHGSGRPCFWAGNGCLPKVGQYKGLGVLLFDIDPAHDADYTHAYFPTHAFTRVEQRGSWFFGEREGAYAAVYAANGLELTQTGVNRGRELKSKGRRNIWLVRASDRQEYDTFEQFIDSVLNMPVDVSTDDLRVRLTDGTYGETSLSWQEPLVVNGETVSVKDCGVKGRLMRKERVASYK